MNLTSFSLSRIIEQGKIQFERTDQFKFKIEEIKIQVSEIYDKKIANESNRMKRVLLNFEKLIEIKKRIRKFSSLRNLHLIID